MKRHTAIQILVLLVTLLAMVPSTAYRIDARQDEATLESEAVPEDRAAPEDLATTDEPTEIDRQYEAYGFLFEQYDRHGTYGRFTAHQVAVLGAVIIAYADLVGGPQKLAALVNGPVYVRQDRQAVVSYTQAGKVIGLGRGAFDLALTTESNFYTWGARGGDELAQIVFGHEIGHRWIEGLRRRDGRDWARVYGQNVWRGERPSARTSWDESGDQADPEEEAVTNLALYVLGKETRWTFLHDAPATEGRQLRIDGWVYDVTINS